MENIKKTIPDVLYRGLIIKYPELEEYNFTGVDIIPNSKPIIDEQGRKLIGDGNEYGVYMTDYKEVAAEAYGHVEMNDGTPLNNNISYGYEKKKVVVPSIGVVYEINTKGLNTHTPWVTDYLKGHYNNGYKGDEYVTERIPKENYKVSSIKIGKDNLHEEEELKINESTNIKEEINKIIKKRKERLEEFEYALEQLTDRKRASLTKEDIDIYKLIFKENGLNEIDLASPTIKDGDDLIKYIMSCVYLEDIDNINLKYLKYLNTYLGNGLTINDFKDLIEYNFNKTFIKKIGFINKKEEEGVTYTTAGFDRSLNMITYINNLIDETLIRQAELQTGKRVALIDTNEDLIEFYQELEKEYYDGYISIDQYNAYKRVLIEFFDTKELSNTKDLDNESKGRTR